MPSAVNKDLGTEIKSPDAQAELSHGYANWKDPDAKLVQAACITVTGLYSRYVATNARSRQQRAAALCPKGASFTAQALSSSTTSLHTVITLHNCTGSQQSIAQSTCEKRRAEMDNPHLKPLVKRNQSVLKYGKLTLDHVPRFDCRCAAPGKHQPHQ